MRNVHCWTWIFARKQKPWKMRISHSSTWNMQKIMENMENEKYILQDLEYGKKTEKCGK